MERAMTRSNAIARKVIDDDGVGKHH